MTEQYTIRPDKFKELRNQLLIKSIPRFILILLGTYAIIYFNLMNDSPSDTSSILVVIFPIVTILMTVGIVIGLSRQRKGFESFKITITDSEIRRELNSMPTIRIRLENIKSISKDKSGNLVIKGENKEDIISILAQVINYEQLEKSLANIREIESENQQNYYQLINIVLSVVKVSGMLIVYYADNKWLVGISGIITSGLIIWSFISIHKNKNVSNGTKLRSYLMILILFSIIVTTYIKLTGN